MAVISYQMWHSRLHGDPRVIGQTILLDRKPYQIIGVMPRDFEFPLVPGQLNRSELWVPLSLTPSDLVQTGSWHYSMIGRLKPGVTPEQAEQDAERVAQQTSRTLSPGNGHPSRSCKCSAICQKMTVAAARPLVNTLFLAVAVVLLMACANLAGLLLVRVIRRRREIAVRLALGANSAPCAPKPA